MARRGGERTGDRGLPGARPPRRGALAPERPCDPHSIALHILPTVGDPSSRVVQLIRHDAGPVVTVLRRCPDAASRYESAYRRGPGTRHKH